MRSPSGGAPGSTRGSAPVAIRTASALISASPALTVPGPSRRPLALITLMPAAASRAVMSADWARARSMIRSYSRAALTVARPPVAMPSPADRLSRVIALDESMTVTSAPSCAATRAASYPPGPPPRIAIVCRGKVTIGDSPLSRIGNTGGPRRLRRTLDTVALYAAYGSNMDPAQMLLRCPHSPQRGTGWLEGWRLTFGGEELGWDGALTTVVEDSAERVFVALYDVPEIDEKELDSWDGVNLGFYSKIKVRVQSLDGDALAWLYVLDAYEGGLPSAQRLSILVDAAVKAGAPADYIDWLRARPSNPPSTPPA